MRMCTSQDCPRLRSLAYTGPHPWHDIRSELQMALAGSTQVNLRCTTTDECDYHADGGPETKCPGICSVDGCNYDATDDEWCTAHALLIELGFGNEVDRVAEHAGITVRCLVREAINKCLEGLR